MRVFDDCRVLPLKESTVALLKQFALDIMDAQREEFPKEAWCWNLCIIEFEDYSPTFRYGGQLEDLHFESETGPCIIVYHPKQIKNK